MTGVQTCALPIYVLSDETEQSIINTSASLAEASGAQIVIVTVPSLEGDSIENYAYELFKDWGIGDAKKNNGVLLILAIDDRKSRIEVGYGLEGALNDAKTGRIQDDFLIGHLQNENYDDAVMGTYLAIAEEVYREYNIDVSQLDDKSIYYDPVPSSSEGKITLPQIFLGIIVGIIILLDIIFNRGRLTRFIIYIAAHSSKGSRGGGGGFGGGGGRSGGGGSSRSW